MAYEIIERRSLAPNVHFVRLRAPLIAQKARPGQFVVVKIDSYGERIPLSLCGWDKQEGTIELVFLDVGVSTRKLATGGNSILSCSGPLGNPTEIASFGTVICAAGCYGIGCLLPVARALKEAGNKVIVAIEARGKHLLFWEDEYRKIADEVLVATFDGSYGAKGHASDLVRDLLSRNGQINRVITVGCTYMMKIITEAASAKGVPVRVSLNPIMMDGTGMCGVCRVLINGERKFACIDGPDFDGREVDWDNLIKRKSSYLEDEMRSLSAWECKTYG